MEPEGSVFSVRPFGLRIQLERSFYVQDREAF